VILPDALFAIDDVAAFAVVLVFKLLIILPVTSKFPVTFAPELKVSNFLFP